MIRTMMILLCTVALCTTGCYGSGQQATYNRDDWFRRQSEQFEQHHADHAKRSSDAVRGYLRHRNR